MLIIIEKLEKLNFLNNEGYGKVSFYGEDE